MLRGSRPGAGIVIKDDDKEITIAQARCINTSDVPPVLCVPRANVRSIRLFTV